MIPLVGRAAYNPDYTLKAGGSANYAHPDLDEGNAFFDQPVHDRAFGLATVHADEGEVDPFEQMEVIGGQRFIMLHQTFAAEFRVDVEEVSCLRFLGLQFCK